MWKNRTSKDTRLHYSTMPTYKLISWGANSHGQLGQGVLSEQCVLPQEVDLSECGLRPESVRKIVGGGGHTLILDAEGRVYSCGRNDKGQTGVSDSQLTNVLTFRRLSLDDKTVVDVCCGWDSSAALTKEGDLYLWGSNRYGQLGDDPSIYSSTSSPICTIQWEKVKRVSMGLRHTAVVTDNGKVLVCGANSKGQLGLPNAKQSRDARHRFTAVPELTDVEDIVCGEHHTVAATQDGGAYTTYFFGDNKHGQAGLDPRKGTRICPAHRSSVHCELQLDAPIHIYAGWSHTNILNDGVVYSWGRNSYGQLGRGKLEEAGHDFWRMQRVENLPAIVQLSVGSEHNVALAESGAIFCWGWNEHGNCGNGNTKDVPLPERVLIPHNSIGILVGSGAGHSFAVIKNIN